MEVLCRSPMKEIKIENVSTKKLKLSESEKVILKFAKLSDNAFAPTKGSKLAAGYDLYR